MVVYYYNEDRISLDFKAVAGITLFKDRILFLAYHNPSEELMENAKMTKLPAVGGLLPVENEHDE